MWTLLWNSCTFCLFCTFSRTAITKRMVAELFQYIEVYPAVKEDGVTNQRVTIHYNCIGAFEVPDRRKIPERDILLETRKGVALPGRGARRTGAAQG